MGLYKQWMLNMQIRDNLVALDVVIADHLYRGNRWSIGKENSNNQKIEEGQLSRIFLPMLATFRYGRTSYSMLSKTKPIYKSSRVSNLKLPSLTYKTAKVKQSDGNLSDVNNHSMT